MKKSVWLMIFLVVLVSSARAQATQDDVDNQSWNDLVVTVPITEKVDVFIQGTLRFGQNVSRLNEKRLAIGYIWKPTKWLSVSPFYWNIVARNTRGLFVQENRLNLRAVYKFPFKKIGLSHRSWLEYRYRRPLNTWRYRPSLTIEKEIKFIPSSKLFLTEEIFYDSGTNKFSRNRILAGITKTLTKKLAVDLYFMHQSDGYTHPGDLNVIGTTWKLKI